MANDAQDSMTEILDALDVGDLSDDDELTKLVSVEGEGGGGKLPPSALYHYCCNRDCQLSLES